MEEKEIKRYVIVAMFIVLAVLSFLIIKPIFIAVFTGIVLVYIFSPIYNKINSKIKSKNISAIIVVGSVVLIVLTVFFIAIVMTFANIEKIYDYAQSISDISLPLKQIFPEVFNNPKSANVIYAMSSSLNSKITGLVSSTINNLLFNLIPWIVGMFIAFFIFFVVIRDQNELKEYLISISPFSKEYQTKLWEKFDQVTYSTIYGHLILGTIAGLVSGVGYFIFGVPNVLVLTIATIFVSILPVIGPWLIWVPVDLYLIYTGHTGAGIGFLVYGLFVVTWGEAVLRPLIFSKMAKMNEAIALVGMLGGMYLFGVMGLIIGPLILAYLFLIIEAYKNKNFDSIILQERPKETAKT